MLCLVDKLETYQDEEMKDRAENNLESRDAWGAISKEATLSGLWNAESTLRMSDST